MLRDLVFLSMVIAYLWIFRFFPITEGIGRLAQELLAMSHHFVEFKNVYFRYPDGTEALKGITFRITHGESVGIVGANGAGKSTLLLHMNGYLMPTSGTVTIGDLSLTGKTRRGDPEEGRHRVSKSRRPAFHADRF